MRHIATAILIPAICMSLAADTSGRISAKVTTKAGVGIKDAKVKLERSEITWAKEIKSNDKGQIMLVGLEPKEFKVTVSAEGYVTLHDSFKIPVGDVLERTYVLLTPDEARAAGHASDAPKDPNEAKLAAGAEAYNHGIALYNEQKYAEALPLFEQAFKNLTETTAAQTDPETKKEWEAKLPALERLYAVVLIETVKADPAKRDLAKQAEPMLVRAFERNPKDQRVVGSLLDLATIYNDAEMTKKYTAAMDAIIGPRPELAYNEGVTKHNAGDEAGAKLALQKAITLDPKFPESYYLLGVVEFSLGNSKAAKENFKKYMDIAPTGRKAGEVKEFLHELK